MGYHGLVMKNPAVAGCQEQNAEGEDMRQAKAWIGRKYVWLAAVLLLLVAVCVSAAAETYPFTSVATVKVNMRRSASSTAALVDRIP